MAKAAREARILLEPEEYNRLETLADRRGISVPDLIRQTVRTHLLPLSEQRKNAVEAICRLQIPLDDWDVLEEEIAVAHARDLP